MIEILLILVHLVEAAWHAAATLHLIEAGIVVTNIALVRVTAKTLPEGVKQHFRLRRLVLRRLRHQHRFAPLCPKYARYAQSA
jgi:hypothetical protein